MDGVVADGSDANIDEVAEHGEIGNEEERSKEEPTPLAHKVNQEAGYEDSGALEMQQRPRVHGTQVSSPSILVDDFLARDFLIG